LLRWALQSLQEEGHYHFAVCQATAAAIGFYETIGFTRVGALAKFAPLGTPADELQSIPFTGYRHWADAHELMAVEFGDISYLMALDLREWDGGPKVHLEVASEYPEVKPMPNCKDLRRMTQYQLEGGTRAYESGDGVLVTFSAEGDGEDDEEPEVRMDVRYEVKAIINSRGSGPSLEYEVVWAKHQTTTWEPAANMVGASAALREYLQGAGHKKKSHKKKA